MHEMKLAIYFYELHMNIVWLKYYFLNLSVLLLLPQAPGGYWTEIRRFLFTWAELTRIAALFRNQKVGIVILLVGECLDVRRTVFLWSFVKSLIHRKAHNILDFLVAALKQQFCMREPARMKTAYYLLRIRLELVVAAEDYFYFNK